jgi:hypothetical protein
MTDIKKMINDHSEKNSINIIKKNQKIFFKSLNKERTILHKDQKINKKFKVIYKNNHQIKIKIFFKKNKH